MRADELDQHYMKMVKTPNGPGKLGGMKIIDGQIRALVVHEVGQLVTVDRSLEVSFHKVGNLAKVFYSYPPEQVELLQGNG